MGESAIRSRALTGIEVVAAALASVLALALAGRILGSRALGAPLGNVTVSHCYRGAML